MADSRITIMERLPTDSTFAPRDHKRTETENASLRFLALTNNQFTYHAFTVPCQVSALVLP